MRARTTLFSLIGLYTHVRTMVGGTAALDAMLYVLFDLRYPCDGKEADCCREHLEQIQQLEEQNVASKLHDDQNTMTVNDKALFYWCPFIIISVPSNTN